MNSHLCCQASLLPGIPESVGQHVLLRSRPPGRSDLVGYGPGDDVGGGDGGEGGVSLRGCMWRRREKDLTHWCSSGPGF